MRAEEELRKWSEELEPRFSFSRRVALAKALLTGGLSGFARKLGEFVGRDEASMSRRFSTCNDISSYIFINALLGATKMDVRDVLKVVEAVGILMSIDNINRLATICPECREKGKEGVM